MSTDEMQVVGGASDAGADGRWGGRGGPDELLVPEEARALRIRAVDAGVMAGGQQFPAQTFRVVAKHSELYLPVAQHVRVGRAAVAVLVEEILEHLVAVLP